MLDPLSRLRAVLDAQMPMANKQAAGHSVSISAFGRRVRDVCQTEKQLQEQGAVSNDSPMAGASVPGCRQDSDRTVFQLNRNLMNPLLTRVYIRSSSSSMVIGYQCEVDETRLQNKMNLLNKRIPTLIQEIRQIAMDRNLSTLSEQIQRCCFNCLFVQDVLRGDPSRRFSSNINKLEQRMGHYDDQLVECLLSYHPESQDEQQELFIMCIWYLNLLAISDKGRSANILVIGRKMVAILQDGLIQKVDKERARLRIASLYSIDDSPMDDERLSRIVFGQIVSALKNIRCHSLDIAKCEKLFAIVEQLITSDPLFRLEQVAEDLLTQWQQMKVNLVDLTTSMIKELNFKRQDFMNGGEFDEGCTLQYMFFCLGFWPSALCSPDIGLIALLSLYQHRSLSSVRGLLVKIQKEACSDDRNNPAMYALMEFLLHNACEDSVARVKNDDLRYYLKSLICYLDGRVDEAVSQARLSRLPEAFWLLGKLQMGNGAFAEAITSVESAIVRGVEAGKLQLALLLLKSPEPDLLKVSGLLNDVMEHYGNLGAVKLQSQLAEVRDSLELSAEAKAPVNPPALNDDWLLSDDKSKRSSAVATRNRNKGKRYKHKRAGSRGGKEDSAASSDSQKTGRANKASDGENRPTVDIAPSAVPKHQTRWLSRYDMAILSLSVTHAISCQGYDYAYQLLLAANEKINWDFQRATIARMDLWRLRELANDRQHLQLLSQSVQAGEQTVEFSVIPQPQNSTSNLLGQFGLARNECISLTTDASVTRDALRNLVIDKALGWLCFLHAEPLAMGDLKRRWRDHPLETAKQQLTDFEHSLSMAFTTASFLSMLGHLHGDIARDLPSADGTGEGRRIKALSAAFYDAANQFNEWRSRLKNDGVLNNRIARATPLGNLQKIRAMQGRVSREKIENQRYGDDHRLRTEKTKEV